jgi:flagellar basal-body rod protein FlgC
MADPVGGYPVTPRPFRNLLGPLGSAARGMSVQQRFMDVISTNIANAETTRTADGTPYQRQVAVDRGAGQVETVADQSKGRLVYDPGHPDADAMGYVEMPNVDLAKEMVDLMVTRRMYEANASAFSAAKAMLRRALEI